MNKRSYKANVYDPLISEQLPVGYIIGTNKEVVMRRAAVMARYMKKKEHWKKKINISVKLYDENKLEKNENVLPLLTRKF